MYGILLRMGGPYSLRPSDRRFRPPMSTVPPSGTATVVITVTELMIGCWMNWVKTTGWPVAVPSNRGKMGVTTGNRLTTGVARVWSPGDSARRAQRRGGARARQQRHEVAAEH